MNPMLLLLAVPLLGADPQLQQMVPPGVQRGVETDVRLVGARLSDAAELLFYEPGIRVVSLVPDESNANACIARLAPEPDCRLGAHAFRIRTASGISNLMTLSVGALPVIAEVEPNNDFAQPQPIPLGTTVHGVVQNEDVDYFVVDAKAGQRITVEVEGIRLGLTFFDPYLAILNEDRFVLAATDDTPLVWQDAICSLVAPADGRYIIELRESAYGGSGLSQYLLHVGEFPRPMAVYPAGGRPGQSLEVTWLADALGESAAQLTLPEAAGEEFPLFARDAQGISPWPYPFRVVDLPNVLEVEPNNVPEQATPFEAPAALNGILSEPGDVDRFVFPAKQGEVFDVRVYARALRSPVDSVLDVAKLGGGSVASNDDSGGPDSYVRLRVPDDGQYVITVRDHLRRGGPEFVYRVEVTPVEPQLSLSLVERTAFVDVTAPVPRGNRLAVLVRAQRDDFSGEVEMELEGLPPGVSSEVLPIVGDEADVPLLLTASPDAPLAGALVDLVGRHQGEGVSVEGRLRQRTSMVRGQNNREVWNHYTDRMAVAVTEAAPFSIEVVPPKAPLVQDGSMELKVKAARAEGFTAPITLAMLYHPAGLASPTSVTIPEGQTEAVLPLTASGTAKVGTWPIAVMADAAVDGGRVTVSSALTPLQVSEPMLKLAFSKAAVEQGASLNLALEVSVATPFEGAAQIELRGLPPHVSSEPREIGADAAQVIFPIATTEQSPVGQHKTLVCQAVVTVEGEPVTHVIGGGELHILRPPPAPAAEPEAEPEPKPETPSDKPLSRLEQLRLEREAGGKE